MPSISRTLASLSSTTRIVAFRMSAELTMDLLALNDLLRREHQGLFQSVHKLTDLDRFGQIPEESSLQALLDVARHRICTESNHGDVRGCRIFPKDFQG